MVQSIVALCSPNPIDVPGVQHQNLLAVDGRWHFIEHPHHAGVSPPHTPSRLPAPSPHHVHSPSTFMVRAGALFVHGIEWRHREHGRQRPRPLVPRHCCAPCGRVGDDAAPDDPDQKFHRHGSYGDVDFASFSFSYRCQRTVTCACLSAS